MPETDKPVFLVNAYADPVVVQSAYWNNGSLVRAGAVTWRSGPGGPSGPVSAANSLVGTTAEDRIGEGEAVFALSDGNYVVVSRDWDNGGVIDLGAVTWGSGTGGVSGTPTAANSLVGSTAGDRIGSPTALSLPGGRYAVLSSSWDFGASVDARAVTLGAADGNTTGPLTTANSVPGALVNVFATSVSWEPARERLAVGKGTAVAFISYETLSFDGFE